MSYDRKALEAATEVTVTTTIEDVKAAPEHESIFDLFDKVKEHPDYVFGVIFVTEDIEPTGKLAVAKAQRKTAEQVITEAGFDFVEWA